MATLPRLREIRLSFIWRETFSSLLTGERPAAPMAFFGDEQAHAGKFAEVQRQAAEQAAAVARRVAALRTSGSDLTTLAREAAAARQQIYDGLRAPAALTPPWPWLGRRYVHHFWQWYLGNQRPEDLPPAEAWRFVVPLRGSFPFRMGTAELGPTARARIMLDGFFYPHGVVAVIVVRLLLRQPEASGAPAGGEQRGGLVVQQAMRHALQVRWKARLPLTLASGEAEAWTLAELAEQMLADLRQRALGPGGRSDFRPVEPLSVATVIQGSGVGSSYAVSPGSTTHGFLEGLCTWQRDWNKRQDLRDPAKANLFFRDEDPPRSLLYHLAGARAVWLPDQFTAAGGPAKHSLGCFHRNQTLLLMQTEMLARLPVLYTNLEDQQKPVPPALASLARAAAERLSLLYSAGRGSFEGVTYQSLSAKAFLDNNGYMGPVSRVQQA